MKQIIQKELCFKNKAFIKHTYLIISIKKNLLFYSQAYNLAWRMFQVHLKRTYFAVLIYVMVDGAVFNFADFLSGCSLISDTRIEISNGDF